MVRVSFMFKFRVRLGLGLALGFGLGLELGLRLGLGLGLGVTLNRCSSRWVWQSPAYTHSKRSNNRNPFYRRTSNTHH